MNNIEVIRSHLDQAVSEIDYFLSCEKKWENGKRELVEFYNSMEAKNAASEKSVIKEELSELTPEQDAALGWRTVDGETISDEQRNKVLADIAPSQPMSDEEWENLQDNLRGGWRKSSDKAAEWLQKAGETVAADAIREELNQLPDVVMLEEELISYCEAIRKAAEQVRIILVACQKEQPAADSSKDEVPSLTRVEQAIIEICDGRQFINEEIINELAVDNIIVETRSLKTTVQRLIELGLLHRPDGVNSRKGVTKKT